MKRILFVLMLACSFIARAQVYNNEWIDYSKTYYKFKIGRNGLYRIPQSLLAASGMASTPAEQFQLWRNGKQVPIYTTIPTGIFSGGDYIEFWGVMNDGKPDNELYRVSNYQLNDHWSLETDTSTYFLTVNPVAVNNLRLQSVVNDVASNVLPAEPYFMHKAGKYFKEELNKGYAVNVGDELFSSSYDKGEGWSSQDIAMNGNVTFTLTNLQVYAGGPSPMIKVGISGNDIKPRRYKVLVNSDSVLGNEVDFFNHVMDTASFSLNSLNSSSTSVTIYNYTNCTPSYCPTSDRMVVHQAEITYPRTFDFSGYNNFEFSLPASPTGNFLQISNLVYAGSVPVLYDLTNGKRYDANISGGLLRFALQPSATDRNLVLASETIYDIALVTDLQTRKFIDYTSPANSGDYLIISHPYLFNGTNGVNPVEAYRAYRSSVAGGSYNAKIYLSEELIDQFGFGIKKNPAGIRNFIRYARN
ncbi:MAG TPA: hypothetical protein VHK91_11030, partial [Flavisolibacter sp.]|nr:hypothetical protein [Flavisolibacter sp.]